MLRALQQSFPDAPTTLRPVTFLGGQCSYKARPYLANYLNEHAFQDVRESLERQQAEAAPAAPPVAQQGTPQL